MVRPECAWGGRLGPGSQSSTVRASAKNPWLYKDAIISFNVVSSNLEFEWHLQHSEHCYYHSYQMAASHSLQSTQGPQYYFPKSNTASSRCLIRHMAMIRPSTGLLGPRALVSWYLFLGARETLRSIKTTAPWISCP